jgi:Tfp pilus assembly protein PilN
MKLYTNLLSLEDQQNIRLEKATALLFNFFLWVVLSLLMLLVFMIAGRFYLISELSSVETRIELQKQTVSQSENQQLKNTLNEFNTHLANLVNLEKHQGQWSEVLIEFARLVPKDVAVDSFTGERQTGRIRITGFAKTRESVLRLRQNLLDSGNFTDVNFPLSNLVKPTDLNFNYTFFVKPELLIKVGSASESQ